MKISKNKHPGITLDKRICGGQAVIQGHRIMVWILISMGNYEYTDAEILEQYPSITETDLQNAFTYYESYREEIDAQMQDNESS